MKEIVVGIDFSRSSIQALQYAVNMAKTCTCKIKMVHISKVRDKDSELIKDEKGIKTNILEAFKRIHAEYYDQLNGKISFKTLYGKIWEELSNQAKYTDAEIIVVGAHGMSGFEELWVGNNTMKIASHSEKPVLIVNKNFKIRDNVIEKVILPIDHTSNTLQKIPIVIELAKNFKAQLNVLSLFNSRLKNTDELVEKNTAEAMKMVSSCGLRYINEKKSTEQPAKATIEYALKRNGDLIATMTENETPSSVYIGAAPEQIINLSPIPVLIIRAHVMKQPFIKSEMAAAR
jgi:nucleotide-binding universal stress UspA family protein